MSILFLVAYGLVLLELSHISKFVSEAVTPGRQFHGCERVDETLRLVHGPFVLAKAVNLRAGSACIKIVASDLVIQLINVVEVVAELLKTLSIRLLKVHIDQNELE